MTDKEKILAEIERLKAPFKKDVADGCYPTYYCAMQDIEDFIISLPEEPASEDLEEAAKHYLYSNILYDDVYVGNPTNKDCIEMFKAGANWQKGQDRVIDKMLAKNYAKGYDDCKQQMMAKAFDFTKEHNTACVLASECLRGNGWFSKERDFNDLFRHLSCVDKLFEGKFSGKTKVIVIKEE